MSAFTVEFVFLDEATPRDLHTKAVEAVDEEDAQRIAVVESYLDGDRISVTAVKPAEGAQ